mgnify:CR=1 FL=1
MFEGELVSCPGDTEAFLKVALFPREQFRFSRMFFWIYIFFLVNIFRYNSEFIHAYISMSICFFTVSISFVCICHPSSRATDCRLLLGFVLAMIYIPCLSCPRRPLLTSILSHIPVPSPLKDSISALLLHHSTLQGFLLSPVELGPCLVL